MIKKISNSDSDQIKKRILGFLVIFIIIIGVLYIYFMSSAVREVVDRKNNIKDIQNLSLEQQKIEGSYFSLLNKVGNLDYAYSLGFIDENNVEFVTRPSTVVRR